MYIFSCYSIQMPVKKSLTRLIAIVTIIVGCLAIAPASNCLGNCVGCESHSPSVCRAMVNPNTGKRYSCLPYYTGNNCELTANAYFNFYREIDAFSNWSLPVSPNTQKCALITNNSLPSNTSYNSIGPFSSSLNATKSLSFSTAQNIQRLIIKLTAAVSDSALYNQSTYVNQTTTETVDAQGNTIIETVSTNNKNSSLAISIPFLTLAVSDQLSSNAIITQVATNYQNVSTVNTSCGFVYQYQFVVDSTNTSVFRQILLNFYLPASSLTTWYLLGFSAEGGCSGFAVSSGGKCSTCLSGYYAGTNPDSFLESCNPCDYRCSTCSSSSQCLLCEAYTSSTTPGICTYPSSYRIYTTFAASAGSNLNITNNIFSSLASSQGQTLLLSQSFSSDQSYFIKFYLLYSQTYAQQLSQLNISVNGQPYTSYTTLDTFSSTLLPEVSNGTAQLFSTLVKIDLMGKPCLSNFSLGFKGNSAANEQFYVANLVVVQYSCGQNCLNCSSSAQGGTATCKQCLPFFSLSSNCKTCANGFYLRNQSVCVKCYSNCKQCIDSFPTSCTDCLPSFTLAEIIYSQTCATCLFNFYNMNSSCNASCANNYTREALQFDKNCKACLQGSFGDLFRSQVCKSCWINIGLSSGKCVPTAESAYTYYSNDLSNGKADSSLWKGSQALSAFTCTSDYLNLLGVPQKANHTSKNPASMVYTLQNLPSHRGIILVYNIFKVDNWLTSGSTADNNASLTITTSINAPGSSTSSTNISLKNSFGANICGSDGNEMIWAIQSQLNDHTASNVILTINAPDQGFFVRQLQLYLGNCPDCKKIGLGFSLFTIPMYSDNDTQTGLDVWVTFNHPVYFSSQPNITQQDALTSFANSFKFTFNGSVVSNATLIDNQLSTFNYLKYFIPVTGSYTNSTLTAETSQGDLVYTQDGSVSRQLVSSSQSIQVVRYDDASRDTRLSISQVGNFFHFFTWFSLIVMIICVMLGVGVVFEEFSIVMQIIYYHIYITSMILPPSIKLPLAEAVRMEHLNYFSDIRSIQNSLFGGLTFPSDYIFQQYNIDVYFLRSFYPILIINAIYIGWFIILSILYRVVTACKESQSKFFRFCRSIPQRPVAYFDQIWRYQFLATMWACMLQFTNFQGKGGQVLNLVICILAFIVSIVWPMVVTIYTYRRHFTMNIKHFRYCYHDLYYLKISSVADQPKYYLYVALRFGKYLAYAIFIALFINQTIIGPVLLIFVNIVQAVIAYFLHIYRKGFYLYTRIIENLLLCVSAIFFLLIFGFSDSQSISQQGYENLGYGLSVVFVLIVINGIMRFLYLGYTKVQEWRIGTYDVGEVGEKENYDEHGPIRVPQSQRV